MAGKEFYRNAYAYDIAFNDREFNTECDFLEWCLNEYSLLTNEQLPPKSFLELGCGPAKHVREFAKRGWRSVGIDLSKDMVQFAKDEAARENLDVELFVGDMTNFTLDKPVNLAATLMESISHLVTNEQMVSHFQSVAKNLTPGGIYIIEATHPMFYHPDDEPNTWVSSENGTEVEITFGLPTDSFNTVTQQWLVTSIMKIREHGKDEIVVESKTPIRWYLAQELKALVELSGVFDKYWLFGSLYSIPPFELDDTTNSDSMVLVLRTKS